MPRVIGEEKDSNGKVVKLLLIDSHETIVSFPISLLHANNMEITKDDELHMSIEMYNAWFREPYLKKAAELSAVMQRNFGKLLKHSDIILKNSDFSGLWLPLLQSNMMISGTTKYSLGALLDCWMSSDDLVVNNNKYIINVCGSELSGSGSYVGWSTEKKVIEREDIGRTTKNPFYYFKILNELGESSGFNQKSDLIVARELFDKLEIKY